MQDLLKDLVLLEDEQHDEDVDIILDEVHSLTHLYLENEEEGTVMTPWYCLLSGIAGDFGYTQEELAELLKQHGYLILEISPIDDFEGGLAAAPKDVDLDAVKKDIQILIRDDYEEDNLPTIDIKVLNADDEEPVGNPYDPEKLPDEGLSQEEIDKLKENLNDDLASSYKALDNEHIRFLADGTVFEFTDAPDADKGYEILSKIHGEDKVSMRGPFKVFVNLNAHGINQDESLKEEKDLPTSIYINLSSYYMDDYDNDVELDDWVRGWLKDEYDIEPESYDYEVEEEDIYESNVYVYNIKWPKKESLEEGKNKEDEWRVDLIFKDGRCKVGLVTTSDEEASTFAKTQYTQNPDVKDFKVYRNGEETPFDGNYYDMGGYYQYESLGEDFERASDEDLKKLEDELDKIGFKVVSTHPGWMEQDIHYQIITKEGNQDEDSYNELINKFEEVLDNFEQETGAPCTFNMGLQYDGYVSCGFDVRGIYYKPGEDVPVKRPQKLFFRNGKPADKGTEAQLQQIADRMGVKKDAVLNAIPVDKKDEDLNRSKYVELHYPNLTITRFIKTSDAVLSPVDKAHPAEYDEEDENIEYDYKVNTQDVKDALYEILVDRKEFDNYDEDMLVRHIENNFDNLIKTYEYEVLKYFEDDARQEAEDNASMDESLIGWSTEFANEEDVEEGDEYKITKCDVITHYHLDRGHKPDKVTKDQYRVYFRRYKPLSNGGQYLDKEHWYEFDEGGYWFDSLEKARAVVTNYGKKLVEAVSLEQDYSDIDLIDRFNFENKKANNLPGIRDTKGFIDALNKVGKDKFKCRTTTFGKNISENDINDSRMDISRNGWSIGRAWDSSLPGFNEIYICSKTNTTKENLEEDVSNAPLLKTFEEVESKLEEGGDFKLERKSIGTIDVFKDEGARFVLYREGQTWDSWENSPIEYNGLQAMKRYIKKWYFSENPREEPDEDEQDYIDTQLTPAERRYARGDDSELEEELEAGDSAYHPEKDEYYFLKKTNKPNTFELYTYSHGKFVPASPRFIDKNSPFYNKLKLVDKNANPEFKENLEEDIEKQNNLEKNYNIIDTIDEPKSLGDYYDGKEVTFRNHKWFTKYDEESGLYYLLDAESPKLSTVKEKIIIINKTIKEDIEKHDTLNPVLFENNELKPEIKEAIEKIANTFVEDLKENEINIELKDIVLVGSNVSYNYTKDSDLDIHLIVDSSALECPRELVDKLYGAYRAIFNGNYDITIKGIPAEIYVELDNIGSALSNGIYSLNTGWIKEPTQQSIPELDKEAFDKLFDEWHAKYEELLNKENVTSEDVKNFINDIYVLRKSSIAEEGEYALGNLVFKEFRNQGILDDLKDLRRELKGKELSLEHLEEDVDKSIYDTLETGASFNLDDLSKFNKRGVYIVPVESKNYDDGKPSKEVFDKDFEELRNKHIEKPEGKIIGTYHGDSGRYSIDISLVLDAEDLTSALAQVDDTQEAIGYIDDKGNYMSIDNPNHK